MNVLERNQLDISNFKISIIRFEISCHKNKFPGENKDNGKKFFIEITLLLNSFIKNVVHY